MKGRTGRIVNDDRVPVFRTWPIIYAAVILNAILVMWLLYKFSRWAF